MRYNRRHRKKSEVDKKTDTDLNHSLNIFKDIKEEAKVDDDKIDEKFKNKLNNIDLDPEEILIGESNIDIGNESPYLKNATKLKNKLNGNGRNLKNLAKYYIALIN